MKTPRILYAATVDVTLRAFLLPHARHFRAMGFEIDAASRETGALDECGGVFGKIHNVLWARNPLAPRNIRAAWEFRKTVIDGEYAIVHLHTPVAAFVGRLALRRLRPSPVIIYTAHGFHFSCPPANWRERCLLALEKIAGRWTDYLVVINRDDEGAARRYSLASQDQIRYIPGVGVDTEMYAPGRVAARDVMRVRAELNLRSEARLLTMIAEFNPGKRHRDAVRALASLDGDVHLALAGEGRLVDDTQCLVRSLALEDRVHFLGFRRDIAALIRASAATVLPSEREGLPRSVMESLSLEVPVIATDIRGIRELVSADCGALVPVGDIPGLAAAMRRILGDPDRALAMGRNGRKRMKAFDIRHVLELHEELYAEALGESIHVAALF